jgi:hypothetical protein
MERRSQKQTAAANQGQREREIAMARKKPRKNSRKHFFRFIFRVLPSRYRDFA